MEYETNSQEFAELKDNINQRLVDIFASEQAYVETGQGTTNNRIHADATFTGGEELAEQGLEGIGVEYDGPTTVMPLEAQSVRLDVVGGEHEHYLLQRLDSSNGEWQRISRDTGIAPANLTEHQRLLRALEAASIDSGLTR